MVERGKHKFMEEDPPHAEVIDIESMIDAEISDDEERESVVADAVSQTAMQGLDPKDVSAGISCDEFCQKVAHAFRAFAQSTNVSFLTR